MKEHTRKSVLLITGIIFLTLIVVFIIFLFRKQPQHTPPPIPTIHVETIVVHRTNYQDFYVTGAPVKPKVESAIRSQVGGRVVYVSQNLEVGKRVTRGETLIKIDREPYLFAFQKASAMAAKQKEALRRLKVEKRKTAILKELAAHDVALARKELERNRKLLKKKVISPSQLDTLELNLKTYENKYESLRLDLKALELQLMEVQNALKAAKADLDIARKNLSFCTVKAPMNGTITEKNVNFNDIVALNTPLYKIQSERFVKVEIAVQYDVSREVKVGTNVDVTSFNRGKTLRWKGTVVSVGSKANELNRTFPVIVEVDNSLGKTPLLPGIYAEVRLPTRFYPSTFIVPRNAIVDGNVFLYENGKAVVRKVVTGELFKDSLQVLKGLKDGDEVIVTNIGILFQGAPVVKINP